MERYVTKAMLQLQPSNYYADHELDIATQRCILICSPRYRVTS